jgi:hypothetical protein
MVHKVDYVSIAMQEPPMEKLMFDFISKNAEVQTAWLKYLQEYQKDKERRVKLAKEMQESD